MVPKWSQNEAQGEPKGAKMVVKGVQMDPLEAPGTPQDAPDTPQDAQGRQNGTKMEPKGPRES